MKSYGGGNQPAKESLPVATFSHLNVRTFTFDAFYTFRKFWFGFTLQLCERTKELYATAASCRRHLCGIMTLIGLENGGVTLTT